MIRIVAACVAGLAGLALACGDADSAQDGALGAGDAGPTPAPGSTAAPTPNANGPSGGTIDPPPSTGGGGAAASDGGAPAAEAGADGSVPTTQPSGSSPKTAFLPTAFGACPAFVGPIITLATPKGPRTVKIALTSAAQTMDGPLVFYWHGWHSSNTNPISVSGWSKELVDMGGVLVHPMIDTADEDKYWDEDDIVLADQVVACAIDKVGIDKRRIYTTGFSAGGFQSYRLAQQRSGYIAAAVLYSPGISGSSTFPYQDPANEMPIMLTHGGDSEDVFRDLALQYEAAWTGAGRLVIMCEHSGGHVIPSGAPPAAWTFLKAHPFGTAPSPYATGLPSSFPAYCSL